MVDLDLATTIMVGIIFGSLATTAVVVGIGVVVAIVGGVCAALHGD